MHFKDRAQAGKKLAEFFKNIDGKNAVVYALPRGGVIVGAEIAKKIHAPLDLIITRKIGHPLSPEYAIGAVAENGHAILNKEEVLNLKKQYIASETEKEKTEAKRRREVYMQGQKPVSCEGKTAILVDDGIATGLTMKTALKELKMHNTPKKIIIAVPVAPYDITEELIREETEVLSIIKTKNFLGAIGSYYEDFSAVSDDMVTAILKKFKVK